MKPIIHGTEKQIAYATRLREDHIDQLRKYVDDDNALLRRTALLKIAKIEDCDDAATLIDWILDGIHMGERIITIRESESIRLGVKADRTRFAQSNPRPEPPADYTPTILLRPRLRRARHATVQQSDFTKDAAYEKASRYEKADQEWFEARDRYMRAHDTKPTI